MSEEWAVVVRQDKAETDPERGRRRRPRHRRDRRVATPAGRRSGGSWALTAGDLYYPTYGDERAYCLATARPRRRQRRGRLVRPRPHRLLRAHGERARRRDDDLRRRPPRRLPHRQPPRRQRRAAAGRGSGRTARLGRRGHRRRRRLVGGARSHAARRRRVFHASADGTYFDLGPGTTGTAVPCGDSVFFVRDPQGPDEPARLMRWTPRPHARGRLRVRVHRQRLPRRADLRRRRPHAVVVRREGRRAGLG